MHTGENIRCVVLFRGEDVARRRHDALSVPFGLVAEAGRAPLAEMLGAVEVRFVVAGDPVRPLYLDPAVRRLAQSLRRAFPHLFFFLSLEGEGLKGLCYACLENVRGAADATEAVVEYDRDEFQGLFRELAEDMERLFERAGLSAEACEARLAALSAYFGLGVQDWAD